MAKATNADVSRPYFEFVELTLNTIIGYNLNIIISVQLDANRIIDITTHKTKIQRLSVICKLIR